jgi:L-iditol 2-dehydrogenase
MKTIVISQPGRIEIEERERPIPERGEVRVRITAVGLCGTDLHLFEGNFGSFPIVPGHDAAGCIDAVGDQVLPGRIGERVTIDPAGCCLRAPRPVELCPACQRDDTHLCRDATYMGMSVPGTMAEYVVVPAKQAIPLAEEINDETATVLEPVVVALHLKEKIADRPGDALVIGGGPIGIVVGLVLQLEGRNVILSEPLANRRELAAEMGISNITTPDQVQAEIDVALVIETSGHPSATDTIVKATRKGATVVLAGGVTDLPGIVILTRELEVRAAKGGRGLYPEAIELVASGRLPIDRLISHRFTAAQTLAAFQTAAGKRSEVTRAVVDMTRW